MNTEEITKVYFKTEDEDGVERYLPYPPDEFLVEEVESEKIIHLMMTLVAATLCSIETSYPNHARTRRELNLFLKAYTRLATKVCNCEVDSHIMNLGLTAWNDIMQRLEWSLTPKTDN